MEGMAWRARHGGQARHGGHGMEGAAWRATPPPSTPFSRRSQRLIRRCRIRPPSPYTSIHEQPSATTVVEWRARRRASRLASAHRIRELWEFSPLVVFALDARRFRSRRSQRPHSRLSPMAFHENCRRRRPLSTRSGAAGVTACERRDSFESSDWNSSSRRPRSPLAASAFVALASGAPRERPMARTVVQTRAQRQRRRRRLWTAATFFAMVVCLLVVSLRCVFLLFSRAASANVWGVRFAFGGRVFGLVR